jgi:hypothetical protein
MDGFRAGWLFSYVMNTEEVRQINNAPGSTLRQAQGARRFGHPELVEG